VNIEDAAVRSFDGVASRIDSAGLRNIGFTSALLGEGVSTLALGTALSLATLRRESVLLVDANWLEPSLSRDAGLARTPGLAECLAGKMQFTTAVQTSGCPWLSFLPSGDPSVARPTLRTLSSLFTSDTDAFRTVVIDLPPVLAGEAFVLPFAALLHQLFVVVREAATPLPLARQALEKVASATPQVILNRVPAPSAHAAAQLAAART
jgi:Mrp family chromosome partitioning ATPase